MGQVPSPRLPWPEELPGDADDDPTGGDGLQRQGGALPKPWDDSPAPFV